MVVIWNHGALRRHVGPSADPDPEALWLSDEYRPPTFPSYFFDAARETAGAMAGERCSATVAISDPCVSTDDCFGVRERRLRYQRNHNACSICWLQYFRVSRSRTSRGRHCNVAFGDLSRYYLLDRSPIFLCLDRPRLVAADDVAVEAIEDDALPMHSGPFGGNGVLFLGIRSFPFFWNRFPSGPRVAPTLSTNACCAVGDDNPNGSAIRRAEGRVSTSAAELKHWGLLGGPQEFRLAGR